MGTSTTRRPMPYILGAFCIIPVGGTFYRLAQIIQEGQWWPRFNPMVVDNFPLFIHGVSMVIFLVLGALQFSVTGPFAQRQLHRILGRIAVLGAVIGGLSGVWMTLAHVEISSPLLLIGRLFFGTAMAAFAIFAIWEAMHRNLISHRNWIIRSYAIAFNAASLPLLTLSISPVILIIQDPAPIIEDAIHLLGWIINLIVAEKFFVRRVINKGALV